MSKLVVDARGPSICDERGQTMAEYGVVLALVTLAVLGAMTLLGGSISGAFTNVAGLLP